MFVGDRDVISIFRHVCVRGGGGGVISIFRHVCVRGGGGGRCNIYIPTRVCS